MRGKKIVLGLLAGCLAVTAAACSKQKDGQQSAGASTSALPSATAGKKPIDISFMNFAFSTFPPPEGKAVDMIKEKFNATIKSQFIAVGDYYNKLSVLMATGDIADVTSVDRLDSTFINFARQGAFLPLDEYIDKYESLKAVPKAVWDQLRVDGKLYSIPNYNPSYVFSIVIRQDWLDKLGLKMPTNYEELKKVAIAFTKDDPDGNGKADTYGMVLYQNIGWDYQGGAYWSSAWYHKDADNNFIPGMIGPGRKELIQTMADVYAQGAINKDFAIVTADQAYKEFYSGKAGMFLGTPKGMSEPDYLALLKVNPQAVVVPVPYFVAPDGKQGAATGPGFYGMTTLSGKLKGQTEKIDRIFEIMNFGRKWIPVDQRTPQNKDFDWLFGHEGTGYDMVNGLPVLRKGAEKDTPFQYMLQRHENYNPWAPSDNDNQYSKTQYSSPEMQQFIAKIEKMERESNKTPYADPSRGVFSETNAKKGAELNTYLINEQTKMISGNRPVADWDKLVKEWKDRGGADVIKEVNAGIKERQSNK